MRRSRRDVEHVGETHRGEDAIRKLRLGGTLTVQDYAQGMAALDVWAIGVSVRKMYAIEAHTGLIERVLPVTLHDLDYGKLK